MAYYNRFPLLFSSGDPDVTAFLAATGITDPTEVSAVTTFVAYLKGNNLWTNGHYMYLFLGGTSASIRYNLLNTSTFYGTLNGGNTITSSYWQPNGTNGYINTTFNPSVSLSSVDSVAFGHYWGSTTTATCGDGIYIGGSNEYMSMYFYDAGANMQAYIFDALVATISPSTTNGFHQVSRQINGGGYNYKNNDAAVQNFADNPMHSLPNTEFYLGGINNIGAYNPRRYYLSYMYDGLTAAQLDLMEIGVNNFMTALSKNTY